MTLRGLTPYPALELKHAWKLLLQNQPHDSICGCSIDAVHNEMQMRTVKLHQILSALEAEAVRSLFQTSEPPGETSRTIHWYQSVSFRAFR